MVKIHAFPMCTEYHAFGHGHKTGFLGHEGAGEVIEVAQPGKVEIGDRVVIMPNTLVVDARSVLLVTIFTVWITIILPTLVGGTRQLHYGTVYLAAVMDVAQDSSRCLLRSSLVSLLCIRSILQ